MPAPSASSGSSSSAAPATLRLLHTSDLQLDAPFVFLGEKGASHRQQLRATFGRIVQLARQGGYHLLLIAGDLFNDNRPSRSSLDLVREALAALPIPVCILPGNHDCYDRASVYRRVAFPANVRVLTETPSVVDFPELDLTVRGNAVLSRHSAESSLRGISGISSMNGINGIERCGDRRWRVVMAHGNVCIPGRIREPERPILPEEIAGCGADYLALGDWHSFAAYSQSTVAAYYSGAPEPTSLDASGSGYVASVTLSDQGVAVERVRVGATETGRLIVDVTGRSGTEIIGLISRQAKPTLMLEVVLRGLTSVDQVIDAGRVAEEAAGGFYWLRVANQSHLELAHLDPADFPETHVIGQYVRMLTQRIQTAASEAERTRAERALQLGVALLRGQETLA